VTPRLLSWASCFAYFARRRPAPTARSPFSLPTTEITADTEIGGTSLAGLAFRLQIINGWVRLGPARLLLQTSNITLQTSYLPLSRGRVAGMRTEKWVAPGVEIAISTCPETSKENLRAGAFSVWDCCRNVNTPRIPKPRRARRARMEERRRYPSPRFPSFLRVLRALRGFKLLVAAERSETAPGPASFRIRRFAKWKAKARGVTCRGRGRGRSIPCRRSGRGFCPHRCAG
jgi:hypothetical protein